MQSTFSGLEKQIAQEVSSEILMKHVHEISRYVRISGSHDEAKSLEYVKSELGRYGLKVTEHRFDAYIGYPEAAELFVTLPEHRKIEGVSAALAPSTPNDGTEAEMNYVGWGSEEEFSRRDVRGKLVLAEGLAEPEIAKRADTHGAVGEVFINDDHAHEGIVSVVWGTPRFETVSLLPATPCISITESDGKYLKQLIEKGNVRVKLLARTWRGWRKIPVVTADMPGAVERGRFVLLSGHIDSWHYGAMDNGSANALMLEVGRVLSEYRKELRRGLMIAFWSGHSHGRYAGSTWYADNFWLELEKNCIVHVNVDSAGSKGASMLTETSVMPETKDFASSVIERVTGQELSGRGFSRAGDQSFWGIGIPSIFMSISEIPVEAGQKDPALKTVNLFGPSPSGAGWWWHTPYDTIDKIDADNLKRDAIVYTLLILGLCANPILPLNYERAAEELKRNLEELEEVGEETFDLQPLIRQTERLMQALARLNRRTKRTTVRQRARIDALNHALMRLGRTLIPITHTQVGRYDHDLAVPIPPLPRLDEIRKLAKLERESDDFKFLFNGLRRNANQVADALDKALEVVNRALLV